MNLAKEISILLYKHHCVIIPEFGAFIANEKKAEVNEFAKSAQAKTKTIAFNNQITHNDGLLASYISKTNNISFETALLRIANAVAEMKSQLSSKKNFELTELGTFYETAQNKLLFVPYHSVNFEISSYGLPKLRLQGFANRIPEPIQTPVAEIKPVEPKEEKKVEPVIDKVRFARRIAKQEIKAAKQVRAKKAPRSRGMQVVNTLGALFLIAMTAVVINFEYTNSYSGDVASILSDSPTTELETNTSSKNSQSNAQDIQEKKSYSLPVFAICIDQLESEEEAAKVAEELSVKYTRAHVEHNNNGTFGVNIISFTNQELANEYINFIQHNIKHKLILKNR